MDNLYIEAYKFYKNDYAHGLVLFHIQSHFEAYEDVISFRTADRLLCNVLR